MQYIVTKWKSAKAEFLAALNAAKAARKAAEEHISATCGQRARFYNLSLNKSSPFYGGMEMSAGGEVYCRQTEVCGSQCAPDANKHWPATLSAVRAETEFLREWALPEKWETLWASSQE